MRLLTLRLRGITEAFPNEVSVDFDALGPGLIAIVGENGAGKSTLIGSVFAALFRQLPGQKRSLYDFATHPQPEIDLTFSVNGARHRSLLKIDPKSRQMESYLFNGEGKPLTNGKKEPFEELVRKCAGTPEFFLSSIFSSQKRTGNFLSLDRSERKELFIRELLGLDRLRLIAARAKDKADEVAKTTLGLDGQAKSLKELVEAGVEAPEDVQTQLADISSRLETLEAQKRPGQQRLLELQATEASRKPLLAEVEALKQRLRKTDAEITETKRQIGRDESLLTGKKDLADLTERGATLATRIEELHQRGELHHPDGAARVGGILNALPEKSIRIQQERGPVEFYAWDIAKFKGRDVSQMPYGQRRELYEAVIDEIRLFNRHLHVVPAMPEDGDPVEFYRNIILDRRGLPWSEGVVVKYRDSVDQWFKVKANDTLDVKVIRCIEGTGKFAGSLGAMVVEGPTGVESEIGSFQLTNEQRRWIWEHRDVLTGQIAEVRALTVNESGAIRAGVFVRFHPSRSEAGLLMYSETLGGGDPEESKSTLYRLKSAAGWRRKV